MFGLKEKLTAEGRSYLRRFKICTSYHTPVMLMGYLVHMRVIKMHTNILCAFVYNL
jgi:hypothetical protein